MKKTKSLAKLKNELQLVFNEYIRKRDANEPCISCGINKPVKQAGHFYPVKGYDGLRFHEHNVNGECAGCNCFDEGHLIGYSENLPNKIGQDNFEALKVEAKYYKMNGYKFSRSELIEKIAYYKQKLKEFD